jgi:hypothetical protein
MPNLIPEYWNMYYPIDNTCINSLSATFSNKSYFPDSYQDIFSFLKQYYIEELKFKGDNIDLMIKICRDNNLALLNLHNEDENIRKLCVKVLSKKDD